MSQFQLTLHRQKLSLPSPTKITSMHVLSIRNLIATLAILVVTQTSSGTCLSQTEAKWTGAGDATSWSDATNWDSSVSPNNSGINWFDVTIATDFGINDVAIDNQQEIRINQIELGNGDTLSVTEGSTFEIEGVTERPSSGNVVNDGHIKIRGRESRILFTGDTDISGSGKLSFASSIFNSLGNDSGPRTTVRNIGNTIDGFGSIELKLAELINEEQGLIHANRAGETLAFFQGSSLVNRGRIQASNGGQLFFGLVTNIDNTGGEILAKADTYVHLHRTSVTGGTIRTEGSGYIFADFLSLRDAEIDADFRFNDGRAINVFGDLTNRGSINGNRLNMIFNGDTNLTGGGTIRMGRSNLSGDFGQTFEEFNTLSNIDNTIWTDSTVGTFGFKILNLENGLIVADGSNASFNFLAYENYGTMRADAGRLFANSGSLFRDRFSNFGVLELDNDGEISTADDFVNMSGGAVQGQGQITAKELTNYGTIAAEGRLTVEGNVALADASQLIFRIGEDGSSGLLEIEGMLKLGGELLISTEDFVPEAEDEYDIVTFTQSDGSESMEDFSNVSDDNTVFTQGGTTLFDVELRSFSGGMKVTLSNFRAVAVPEPATTTFYILAFSAICLRRQRRKLEFKTAI